MADIDGLPARLLRRRARQSCRLVGRPALACYGRLIAFLRDEVSRDCARGARGAPSVGVANRGGNRRNSDLAVTIVEAFVLALGVLALLRRSCRFHFKLSNPSLGSATPIWPSSRAKLSGNSCPIVTFGACWAATVPNGIILGPG